MKIAFFTEGGYQGKISRDNPNMRTDLAWICSLNADHWNINSLPNQQYDLGIIIIPKNNPQFDLNKIKQYYLVLCKNIYLNLICYYSISLNHNLENFFYKFY